ncbi:MAG: hypothetical protein ACJ707_01770, partial [Nitrososphaera sp.]
QSLFLWGQFLLIVWSVSLTLTTGSITCCCSLIVIPSQILSCSPKVVFPYGESEDQTIISCA